MWKQDDLNPDAIIIIQRTPHGPRDLSSALEITNLYIDAIPHWPPVCKASLLITRCIGLTMAVTITTPTGLTYQQPTGLYATFRGDFGDHEELTILGLSTMNLLADPTELPSMW